MYVKEFFHLNDEAVDKLMSMKPQFGYDGYGEIVFYRTFSRKKENGLMESWNDCVLRVINGIMSIRKNHYTVNNIPWNEDYWQGFAYRMMLALFNFHWSPPGRGLWQCGSLYMYERGSAALNNCGLTEVHMSSLHDDIAWAMDMLMNGCGIGFRLNRSERGPVKCHKSTKRMLYSVPDTREGWVHSIRLRIRAYLFNEPLPIVDCSQVRKANVPINGFGGVASGPGPLMELHDSIDKFFLDYIEGRIDEIELQANLANAVAKCVVAGNVRRSAEILQALIEDTTFLNLKDYVLKPDRAGIGGYSNNSGIFSTNESFNMIGEIANRVGTRGEPGGINEFNLIYGRLNPRDIMAVRNGQIRPDKARGFNPCGEQQLEHRELCTLVNTFPTRCLDKLKKFSYVIWQQALEFAAFYASTVTLLPTHDASTNAVMQRNRRIGVAISDYTGWTHTEGLHRVINYLKDGYEYVRSENGRLADEAGIPHSIRVTTVKPDGTVSKLAGVTAGCGYPTFRHTLRRTNVAKNSPIANLLLEAGIPAEPLVTDSDGTWSTMYPILQGPSKPVGEATIWEQVANIVTLQRYWSDNAVSNTIYFEPDEYMVERVQVSNPTKEEIKNATASAARSNLRLHVNDSMGSEYTYFEYYKSNPKSEVPILEFVIAFMMPMVKSFSLLPKSGPGVYPQMPESELNVHEYDVLKKHIAQIDWSKLTDNDAVGVKYCDSGECLV
jgi:ribonucleoside-triphosphate reductase